MKTTENKYTDTDLQEFAEFVGEQGFEYQKADNIWWKVKYEYGVEGYKEEFKTTAKLLQEWEIETGRRKP